MVHQREATTAGIGGGPHLLTVSTPPQQVPLLQPDGTRDGNVAMVTTRADGTRRAIQVVRRANLPAIRHGSVVSDRS
jgi:hypothetical protein